MSISFEQGCSSMRSRAPRPPLGGAVDRSTRKIQQCGVGPMYGSLLWSHGNGFKPPALSQIIWFGIRFPAGSCESGSIRRTRRSMRTLTSYRRLKDRRIDGGVEPARKLPKAHDLSENLGRFRRNMIGL